jgi:hemerythrin
MTDFIVWQAPWNTHIPEIDAHHVEMAKQLNLLVKMLERRPAASRQHLGLEDLLNDYMHLTRRHFSWEEEQMRELGFPDYARHKREHTMLLAELNQLLVDIRRNPSAVDIGTLRALKHWLIAHVTLADRAFAGYYHQQQ